MTFVQTILLMLLAHLVADYTLQGWLADGKQKSWWKKLVPSLEQTRYRFDYLAALVCHATYWSILVCAPFWNSSWLGLAIAVNTVVHAVVDDLKANRHKLNLIEDQMIHIGQIVLTVIVMSK